MDQYISELDSNRFGFKIAKINDAEKLAHESFIDELRSAEVKLVISRINAENISGINSLEDMGFRLMDTQSTYRLSFDKNSPNFSFLNPNLVTRPARDIDVSSLQEIARISFNGYGHYAADTRLPSSEVSNIYADWAKRSVLDRSVADIVLVAELDQKIAGFLSFKIKDSPTKRFSAGGLGAVATGYRGKNIFSSLALAGITWSSDLDLNWTEHNVLATNYPINRVFSKIGFTIASSFITFHLWLEP